MLFIAGCSSQASRMAECQNQGISKDACYMAEQNRQATTNASAEAQALQNARHAVQYAQAAKATVKDPLKAVKLTGAHTVDINNGYTAATIDGKKARINRMNANYYELSGNGVIISVALDDYGVTSASWSGKKRAHGILNISK